MYTSKQLIADTTKEAQALRKHATNEELAKLDYLRLDAAHTERCIYGQMTGHCLSARAAELIEACTPRYFRQSAIDDTTRAPIRTIAKAANGTTVENFRRARTTSYGTAHFSAIEAYISWKGAKIKNLVNYLRGETNKLIL